MAYGTAVRSHCNMIFRARYRRVVYNGELIANEKILLLKFYYTEISRRANTVKRSTHTHTHTAGV